MIGIPLAQAFKELGYRNPEAMVEQLKKELADPNLMILRSKQWALSEGLLTAQNQAATMQQTNQAEIAPPGGVNQPSPTLTSSENQPGSKPMASKQGTTSYSSMQGMVDKARQNMTAGGR
jgi:hypothetical protein